jgi:hypothetical protein
MFNKSVFSRQIFIKVPNINLHRNRPVGAVMKRADRRTSCSKQPLHTIWTRLKMNILLVLGRLSTFQASHFNGKRNYRLGRGSAATHMLRLRGRIPTGKWLTHSSECAFSEERSLRRADPSSKGVLQKVCVCVTKCYQVNNNILQRSD